MSLPYASAQDAAYAARFFDGYDAARQVWEDLVAKARAWGPVEVTATKSRVCLKARTRFLWCPQAHKAGTLFVRFWMPHDIVSDRLRRDLADDGRYSMRVRLGPDDLDDEVLGWLRGAYRFDTA